MILFRTLNLAPAIKRATAIIVATALLAPTFFIPLPTQAAYNAANVISNYNFRNASTMSAGAINDFLRSKGSWLTDYVIPEYVDVPYPIAQNTNATVSIRQVNDGTGETFYGKTVAQLIYDEAVQHSINPQVILVTLQKESSAVTSSSPSSDNTRAWPLFYGYDETVANCWYSGACNADYNRLRAINFGGIGQQIAYSTWWKGDRYDRYQSGQNISGLGRWNDPVNIDGSVITCENIATRILYLYTPHAQTNFYNTYSGWWGEPNTPPPSVDDTARYELRTYNGSITISGAKKSNSLAYLGDTLLAGAGPISWSATVQPGLGISDYAITYKDEAGSIISSKPLHIIRHRMADINGDDMVDLLDLSLFATYWGKSDPEELMTNLNPEVDNEINILDLSILAGNWSG